jgi:excinuclease ABC subunit A
LLDEPTTGLSASDVHVLLRVIDRLVESGNTVIIVEHNLEVVKTADWLIDLGPEGGDRGGEVVATGTPEDVCDVWKSYTGNYLRAAIYGSNVKYGSVS